MKLEVSLPLLGYLPGNVQERLEKSGQRTFGENLLEVEVRKKVRKKEGLTGRAGEYMPV